MQLNTQFKAHTKSYSSALPAIWSLYAEILDRVADEQFFPNNKLQNLVEEALEIDEVCIFVNSTQFQNDHLINNSTSPKLLPFLVELVEKFWKESPSSDKFVFLRKQWV